MDPADLLVPIVAVVLVTALAVFAATRRSEPAGPLKRGVAGVATAVVVGWVAWAAVASLTGGPLPGGGGAGYLSVLGLRALSVGAVLVTFWRARTDRAFTVAMMVTLAMSLPELGWAANALR
ncbi:hypothetical protein [Kytococcus sedentarius]|uniref:hypothetical protein n=1 Tax=Kytococcus sedentarius TaxID=1276 RepID=UPI001951FF7D|nr:hypothetical protein [Kytococcus sedentarius]QRO87756.1 hypothetical protein I6J30_01890 [Kytococcus sedentarius]